MNSPNLHIGLELEPTLVKTWSQSSIVIEGGWTEDSCAMAHGLFYLGVLSSHGYSCQGAGGVDHESWWLESSWWGQCRDVCTSPRVVLQSADIDFLPADKRVCRRSVLRAFLFLSLSCLVMGLDLEFLLRHWAPAVTTWSWPSAHNSPRVGVSI